MQLVVPGGVLGSCFRGEEGLWLYRIVSRYWPVVHVLVLVVVLLPYSLNVCTSTVSDLLSILSGAVIVHERCRRRGRQCVSLVGSRLGRKELASVRHCLVRGHLFTRCGSCVDSSTLRCVGRGVLVTAQLGGER